MPKDNIFLFTGENTFVLRQEVGRWAREFREKYGEANLTRLSAQKLEVSTFLNEAASAPFIAEHRLLIVEGIPNFWAEGVEKKGQKKRDFASLFAQVHPQVILLFIEPKPDRRLNTVKELIALAEIKNFAPVSGEPLLRWVQSALQACGARAERDVPFALVQCVGSDQSLLSQEIAKLALHATGRPITRRDIEVLTVASAEQTVWYLSDLLGAGRTQEAVTYCRSLLERGESAQKIWSYFLWIVANFASVVSVVEEGTTGIQGVMQAAGVKFSAARSLIPLARTCKRPELRSLMERVADADIALKTGSLRTSAESEVELTALLDSCLMAFPR